MSTQPVHEYLYEETDSLRLTKSDYIILVMGATGVGKSTFIHRLTGANTGIGKTLSSGTVQMSVYTHQLKDRRLVLVDTPGFRDSQMSDAMVLTILSSWLAAAHHKELFIAGVLCLYRVTETRWTVDHQRNLDLLRAIWGDSFMPSVLFVTTMWPNQAGTSELADAETIATDFKRFWRPVMKKGAQSYKFINTHSSALEIVRALPALQEVSPARRGLQIQVELVDKGRRLDKTQAGKIVEGDIRKMTLYLQKMRKINQKRMTGSLVKGDVEESELIQDMLHMQEETLSRLHIELAFLSQAPWQTLSGYIHSAYKIVLRRYD